jgi:hypothetical protein
VVEKPSAPGSLGDSARGLPDLSAELMSKRADEQRARDLIEQIDVCLRDAERLRNYVENRRVNRPFWPDRRRNSRVPASESPAAKDPPPNDDDV